MKLTGKPVSIGIIAGEVLKYRPFQACIRQTPLEPTEVDSALKQYDATKQAAKAELDLLEERIAKEDPEKAKLIQAHREVLLDPAMDEEIRALIQGHTAPDAAVESVYCNYIDILGRSRNEMMRERASDLRDVKGRLLRCWAGEPECNLAALEKPVIIVADDLYPSDTVSMDRERVLGIVTQVGGSTSHTAIIARSYDIPAVLGLADAMLLLEDGEHIILDAEKGELITQPTQRELEEYAIAAERVKKQQEETKAFLTTEPVTLDGSHVDVMLNVGAANDFELSSARYADGCGLFRTEFLYLNADHQPTEEEQFQIYRKVLLAFEGKPVTLRTLDIGGDKQVACIERQHESNPFLGVRGIRLCFLHEDMFRVQIRAILRASIYGKLQVMLPMISSLDEVRQAKALFAEEGAALDKAGIPWDRKIAIGIMVEVPSIALISDLIADEVDFVSVGTNDLCQYLTASDRLNAAVKSCHQDYHPAMFRMLGAIAKAFQAAGKPVSICGELGGDPVAIPALLGLGIRKFSMGSTALARVKRVVRSLRLEEAQELAQQVQMMKTQCEIQAHLESFSAKHKI